MSSSTLNKPITCNAAVAWGPKQPLSIEQVVVGPPKAGEVRIKILYTSLCHTDFHTQSGRDIYPFYTGGYPVILGHEATGVVESVGAGVQSVRAGDHVIPCFVPQCRDCAFCARAESNLCAANGAQQARGLMPDGTSRFECRGQPVAHFMGCSTFSEYTVCAEVNVCKIDSRAPLDQVSLVGCGFCTGYGAAVKTCKVEPESTVAVWGLGGVGLAAIVGAKVAGARQIVGIDVNSAKFELAKELGATDFEAPDEFPTGKSFVEYLAEKYGGGFDYTFECVGNPNIMRQALETAHPGWGVACMLGVADAEDEIATRPFQIIVGRKWVGCIFGGFKSREDVPRVVADVHAGIIPLSKLITQRLPFAEINKAFELMAAGEGLRTVLAMPAGDR